MLDGVVDVVAVALHQTNDSGGDGGGETSDLHQQQQSSMIAGGRDNGTNSPTSAEKQQQTKDNVIKDDNELRDTVYDIIRTIKDPEKPNTLEELNVVYETGVEVKERTGGDVSVIRVEFNPTVPHCSLATLIGLCIRIKLERCIPDRIKLDIYIKEGAHTTEHEINKQINDKERIAAAMENPNLKDMVENCISEED